MLLPFELVGKIIGYTLDPSQRPYLDDIRTMQSILPRGIKAALVHLRELQPCVMPTVTTPSNHLLCTRIAGIYVNLALIFAATTLLVSAKVLLLYLVSHCWQI